MPTDSAKTANVLFAVEATRRWGENGITANAVHPGAIDTNLSRSLACATLAPARSVDAPDDLSRHMDPQVLADFRASGAFRYKTPDQGAATSVLVATSPQLEGIGGRYFEDCNEATVLETPDPDSKGGVAAYALDPANAERALGASRCECWETHPRARPPSAGLSRVRPGRTRYCRLLARRLLNAGR